MPNRTVLSLLFLVSIPGSAWAQTAPSLTLGVAMEEALRENPSLAAGLEAVPQAKARRDQALAYITPQVSVGYSHRINDREIAFDMGDSFGGLTDAFTGLYSNIGFIYGELFEAGLLEGDDCTEIAVINGFADCAELTSQLEGGLSSSDTDIGGGELLVIQPKELDAVAAQMTWPINPRVGTSLAAGAASVRAAELTVEKAEADVLLAVVRAYAATYQMQESTAILAEQVELARRHVADTQVMVSAGVATRDFLLQARLEAERVKQSLRDVQHRERAMRRTLAFALGRRDPVRGRLAPLPAADLDGRTGVESWTDHGVRHRADGAAAREQQVAADALSVDSALAFLPQFAITGQFNWSDQATGFDDKRTSWWLGLGVNLPIWDGGRNVAEARKAASVKRQAAAQVRAVDAQIAMEVGNAYDAWTSAGEAVPVGELALELAQEVYRLVESRYKAGAARAIEVEDARASLQQAGLSLLNDRVGVQLAAAELLAAGGELRLGSFRQ
jgi:outer membrane protein TolC